MTIDHASPEAGDTFLQTTAIGSRRLDATRAAAWMAARGYPVPDDARVLSLFGSR